MDPINAPDDVSVPLTGVVAFEPMVKLKPLVEFDGIIVAMKSSCD